MTEQEKDILKAALFEFLELRAEEKHLSKKLTVKHYRHLTWRKRRLKILKDSLRHLIKK